jgi:hypothetical protein
MYPVCRRGQLLVILLRLRQRLPGSSRAFFLANARSDGEVRIRGRLTVEMTVEGSTSGLVFIDLTGLSLAARRHRFCPFRNSVTSAAAYADTPIHNRPNAFRN